MNAEIPSDARIAVRDAFKGLQKLLRLKIVPNGFIKLRIGSAYFSASEHSCIHIIALCHLVAGAHENYC